MPAPIVVEIYAPQPKPQELAVLIAACRRAAAPSECITSDVKSSEPPLGVAIVRREGERARIELGLRQARSAEWSTRDLVFHAGDDEIERYRAIGFAIGTLVARQVEPAEPAPAAPQPSEAPPAPSSAPSSAPSLAPPPPLPPPPPPEQPAPLRSSRATWLDLAGSVGLGLVPGPPRVGGTLRAASELVPNGFFAVVEGGYSERVGEPALRARWLSLALGVGHPLAPRLRTVGVQLRLAFALERLSVTALDGQRSAGDSRWKPGAAVGIDGHWELAPPVAVLLSAGTFLDPRRTAINSGGQPAGETPALGLSGFLGLRVRVR